MEIWKKMWVGVFFWTQCMSIPLSNTMTVFSFTKVESWRNANFLPKCIQIAPNCVSNFKNFLGWHPQTHPWGGDTPPQSAPRSALRASTRTPPETNGWIKALAPPMVKSSDSSSCDYLLTRMEKNLGIPRLITWQDIAISNWSVSLKV